MSQPVCMCWIALVLLLPPLCRKLFWPSSPQSALTFVHTGPIGRERETTLCQLGFVISRFAAWLI